RQRAAQRSALSGGQTVSDNLDRKRKERKREDQKRDNSDDDARTIKPHMVVFDVRMPDAEHDGEQNGVEKSARTAVPEPTENSQRGHQDEGGATEPLVQPRTKRSRGRMAPVEL